VLARDCLLLARCRVAVEVHVQAIELGQFDDTPSSAIVLPYLRSMALITFCDPMVLWHHLDLPVLTRLKIHDYEGGALLDDAVFNEFIYEPLPSSNISLFKTSYVRSRKHLHERHMTDPKRQLQDIYYVSQPAQKPRHGGQDIQEWSFCSPLSRQLDIAA
jgi:hypothetical protein